MTNNPNPPETAIDVYRNILSQLEALNEKVERLVTLIDGNADLGVMGLRARMENIEEIGYIVQDIDERVGTLERETVPRLGHWLWAVGGGVIITIIAVLWIYWFVWTSCPFQC